MSLGTSMIVSNRTNKIYKSKGMNTMENYILGKVTMVTKKIGDVFHKMALIFISTAYS